LKGEFEHSAAIPQPVMPIAEPLDSMLRGKMGLGFPRFGKPQIIES